MNHSTEPELLKPFYKDYFKERPKIQKKLTIKNNELNFFIPEKWDYQAKI